MSTKKKIALIMNDDFSMLHFRGGLIRGLVAKGLDVAVIVPPGPFLGQLADLGACVLPIKMDRFISLRKDLRLIVELYRLFLKEHFDIVHTMTVKPNIYGTFAAKLARVPRVVGLVSGAGYLFSSALGGRENIFQKLGIALYGIALGMSDGTWFQNSDDLDEFVEKGLIPPGKGIVIRSGGINVDDYAMEKVPSMCIRKLRQELSVPDHTKCVVMLTARLIWSKGVEEFIKAAQRLQNEFPTWKFIALCPRDENSYESIPKEYIERNRSDNFILVDQFRMDSKNFVALADIMVLPSYYREGVPRSLLEGAAMGKPIITTSGPGCKEVVIDGVNGFLVPQRDSNALVAKLKILMSNERKRHMFGEQSRKLAETEFNEKMVVDRIMQELYCI